MRCQLVHAEPLRATQRTPPYASCQHEYMTYRMRRAIYTYIVTELFDLVSRKLYVRHTREMV